MPDTQVRAVHSLTGVVCLMPFAAFKRMLVSLTRAVTARLLEVRRKRRARIALKDLSPHLLEDIGQGGYCERRELDQDQPGKPADYFRS